MNAEQTLAQHADAAYEAVRAIAALTVFGPALLAPDLYPVLGSLALLGHSLEQALGQLGTGLERSPEVYDLREDDPDRDPAVSIEAAADLLSSAAQHAGTLGHACRRAQAAIAGQGWHGQADQDQADQDQADEADELNGADR